MHSIMERMSQQVVAFEEERVRITSEADAEETLLLSFRDLAARKIHEFTAAVNLAAGAADELPVQADWDSVLKELDRLRDHAGELERLVAMPVRQPVRELAGFAASLKSRYVMARERAAHDL
jgi:hypothetical protein